MIVSNKNLFIILRTIKKIYLFSIRFIHENLEDELKSSLQNTKVVFINYLHIRSGKEIAIVQFDCDMFIQIVIKSYGEIFLPASFNSRRGIIQSEIIKSRAQFKAFSFRSSRTRHFFIIQIMMPQQ